MPGQHDVGPARQILSMKAKSVAQAVQHRAHRHLWFRILTLYATHEPRPFKGRQRVHGELSTQSLRQFLLRGALADG